jgi:glutamate-1-semialdehyde 2,1-aminomutase
VIVGRSSASAAWPALQALRRITCGHGIPLIRRGRDRLRFAYGGAQNITASRPTSRSGKIVGGGFALAAIAGRADIMAHFDRWRMADEIRSRSARCPAIPSPPGRAATLEILKRPAPTKACSRRPTRDGGTRRSP